MNAMRYVHTNAALLKAEFKRTNYDKVSMIKKLRSMFDADGMRNNTADAFIAPPEGNLGLAECKLLVDYIDSRTTF